MGPMHAALLCGVLLAPAKFSAAGAYTFAEFAQGGAERGLRSSYSSPELPGSSAESSLASSRAEGSTPRRVLPAGLPPWTKRHTRGGSLRHLAVQLLHGECWQCKLTSPVCADKARPTNENQDWQEWLKEGKTNGKPRSFDRLQRPRPSPDIAPSRNVYGPHMHPCGPYTQHLGTATKCTLTRISTRKDSLWRAAHLGEPRCTRR